MTLVKSVAITIAYQAAFGAIAHFKQIDTFTDFAGTSNFIVLALYSFVKSGHTIRQKLISFFSCTWGVRLGTHLLRRILSWGEDHRFDNIRNNIKSLITFWSVQGLWVWIVSLPVLLANTSTVNPPLGALDYIGWALYAIGLVTETVADLQKLKSSSSAQRKWMHTGLWKYSRHPNYFGEILVWTGMYLSAAPTLSGLEHLAMASPLFTATILLFLSGIPMSEKSADKKYANNSDYVAYKKGTSVLVPLPPAMYRSFPPWFKRTLLFEYDMYDNLDRYTNRDGKEE